MGMLRRGNRDSLHADQRRYAQIIRDYDRVERKEPKEEGENLLIFFFFSICILIIIGSLLSILRTIYGIHT